MMKPAMVHPHAVKRRQHGTSPKDGSCKRIIPLTRIYKGGTGKRIDTLRAARGKHVWPTRSRVNCGLCDAITEIHV